MYHLFCQYISLLLIFCTQANVYAASPQLLKKGEITIEANSLELNNITNQASANGNIVIKQDDMTLKSEHMTIFYLPSGKVTKISKIVVVDQVLFSTKDRTARANMGILNLASNILELKDQVILTQGKNLIKGDKLIYDLTAKQIKIFSNNNQIDTKTRVKAILIPDNHNDRKKK